MQAQFVHEGKHVDFTPDVDVPVGSIIIQGDLVGITKRDLKAKVHGSIVVEGGFDFPKVGVSSDEYLASKNRRATQGS
ncbi:DUF2190 family protein [Stieleria varia]|uniref:Uncharacterized protein n=1 Tax=Stieleria varia TaxID=2528005 RepID=A0A5C6ATU8_9BACT|nr:DUF2190 family protein [Stieleria varia]TWU02897.1 hypothetical protein Pla52n_39850 [Stieleria varia]